MPALNLIRHPILVREGACADVAAREAIELARYPLPNDGFESPIEPVAGNGNPFAIRSVERFPVTPPCKGAD